MARKKTDSAPDMFAAQSAAPTQKGKAAPPTPPRMAVAATCGSIAGIPAACARAQTELVDVKLRCGKSLASGVLSESQAGLVKRMERQADSALAELKSIRETADLLAVHGEIKSGELF